ncbi:hypothetical protein JCM8208_006461 [Rhodotorula glutinis]
MQTAAAVGVSAPAFEVNESARDMHDLYAPVSSSSRISIPEYMFWAERQRARERADTGDFNSAGLASLAAGMKGKIREKGEKGGDKGSDSDVREVTVGGAQGDDATADLEGLSDRERELCDARRMLRVAGWATIFFLITTDILGPFNAPFAIANLGLGPGIALYVIFGIVAGITGVMLQHLFLKLDSVRYPIRTYGDLGGRIYGVWMRHLCSILQAIQLILNVGLICLSNGQGVAQIAEGGTGPAICFSVAVVIWAILGTVIGQIRSLHGLGLLANSAVWINLLIICLSMGFIAHSPPNFAAAKAAYGISEGPIVVSARVNQPVFNQVNGLMNMVFAYGGSMIFPELLAEMRRPHDFIRSFALAQALIVGLYLIYGIFVYAMQGQYTLALAYQGVSHYAWQTVGNVLALITGAIAAALYGNIGLKVIYINIVEGLLKGPPLMTRSGRIVWGVLVVVFWAAAFFIGSCIPSVGALSGVVASACIFSFSYTLPPLFILGLYMHIDAATADEEFSTPGVAPRRRDTWKSFSRWHRALTYGGWKRTAIKLVLFLFFLAALATQGLGLWGSGTSLGEAFKNGAATSLGCTSPV